MREGRKEIVELSGPPKGAPPEAVDFDAVARVAVKSLWQPGDLFHNFARYPLRANAERVDRLALVLERGLVAPAACADGSVKSDLKIQVSGCSVRYDSLVFLHKFGQNSAPYIASSPGRFTVFVNRGLPVLTPGDMGEDWPVLCADEVYIRDKIPVEQLSGLVIHPTDARSVLAEFMPRFRMLGLPVYQIDGTVIWPQRQ